MITEQERERSLARKIFRKPEDLCDAVKKLLKRYVDDSTSASMYSNKTMTEILNDVQNDPPEKRMYKRIGEFKDTTDKINITNKDLEGYIALLSLGMQYAYENKIKYKDKEFNPKFTELEFFIPDQVVKQKYQANIDSHTSAAFTYGDNFVLPLTTAINDIGNMKKYNGLVQSPQYTLNTEGAIYSHEFVAFVGLEETRHLNQHLFSKEEFKDYTKNMAFPKVDPKVIKEYSENHSKEVIKEQTENVYECEARVLIRQAQNDINFITQVNKIRERYFVPKTELVGVRAYSKAVREGNVYKDDKGEQGMNL